MSGHKPFQVLREQVRRRPGAEQRIAEYHQEIDRWCRRPWGRLARLADRLRRQR